MKNMLILLVTVLITSCDNTKINNEETIANNPYLFGNWAGEGAFFDVGFNKKVGVVSLEIEIKDNYEIFAKIGDSKINNATIEQSDFGFVIKGILNSQIKKGLESNKDHLVILLVLPDENREHVKSSDVNFHLKTNFTFDFTMRVGGAKLTKK